MVYVPVPVTHLRKATAGRHFRHSFQRGMGIAMMFRLMQIDESGVVSQDSLLWGKAGEKTHPRWLSALWEKLFGPFEWGRFQKKRHFWLFWLGEKAQAAGFAWELLRGNVRPRRSELRRHGETV